MEVDLPTVRGFAASQGRISARSLMDAFRIDQRDAQRFVQDMERLGDIGRAGEGGWHPVLPPAGGGGPPFQVPALIPPAHAGDDRFERLKRRLALEFHPDQAGPGELEQAVRAIVFRRIWDIVRAVETE